MKQVTLPLNFDDLELASSQVWGAVRLVPIIRKEALNDIRLSSRVYTNNIGGVRTGDRSYASYIPHGLVVNWGPYCEPGAVYGSSMESKDERRKREKAKPPRRGFTLKPIVRVP